MFKNRYVSGLLLLVFIGISYFVLIKFITPMIVETTTSDLFIEDTGDYRVEGPSSTTMTHSATNFCFEQLVADHEEVGNIDFSSLKNTAYALGGYNYVVKATIPASQSADNQSYVMACQISYDYTSEDPNNAENWDVSGLSYSIAGSAP